MYMKQFWRILKQKKPNNSKSDLFHIHLIHSGRRSSIPQTYIAGLSSIRTPSRSRWESTHRRDPDPTFSIEHRIFAKSFWRRFSMGIYQRRAPRYFFNLNSSWKLRPSRRCHVISQTICRWVSCHRDIEVSACVSNSGFCSSWKYAENYWKSVFKSLQGK